MPDDYNKLKTSCHGSLPRPHAKKILKDRIVMKREVVKSVVWALIVAVLLGVAIIVGSRNLSRFDSALVAYTFASLFAAFGLTYRYAMWLQRPPTALVLAARLGSLL